MEKLLIVSSFTLCQNVFINDSHLQPESNMQKFKQLDLIKSAMYTLIDYFYLPILFVAFVKDNATMSSVPYFENHVSYFVLISRKKTLLNSFLYDKQVFQ